MTGGWAAKELCEKGLRTLVLERGRPIEHATDYVTEHKQPWELPFRGNTPPELAEKDYPVQSQVYLFDESSRHFFINDRLNPYIQKKPYTWMRGHQVGGRSLMWARQCYRWSDLDFEANLKDGHGVDWPIRYADISPWYDYVERFVGVSGERLGLAQLPDGDFLKPMLMNVVELGAKQKIQAAFPDRLMTIGRCAVLTEEFNGRAPCHYCGTCERGCSTASYFSSVGVSLPAAEATGNLTIRPHSNVHSIIYDNTRDRASGVRVVDYESKEMIEFRAGLIFMCASTLGTTQIMLNSKSPRFPDGIANSSGVLGHYLMDHHELYMEAHVDGFEDRYYEGVRPNGIYIPRFRNLDERSARSDYTRGFGFQGGAFRTGWGRGASGQGIGVELKNRLRMPGPWRFWMSGYGDALPMVENTAKLSNQIDEWGIPILEIDAHWSENTRIMRRDIADTATEMLETAGFDDITIQPGEAIPGMAIHEMGTARMGRDPRTSILNAYNQCHDVANLFVTDGACMASSACQNPSITYMALTARATNYAVEAVKRGDLRP